MHQFRKEKVWQRAMDFVTEIYLVTTQFPNSEQFGLTSQTRRASISVALNISEAAGAVFEGRISTFPELCSSFNI